MTIESLEESLEDLSIYNRRPEPDIPRLVVKKTTPKRTAKKEQVADSWEDELSSGEETEKEEVTTRSTDLTPSASNAEGPLAPPPTPITHQGSFTDQKPWVPESFHSRDSAGSPRARPEKQTAVASRMIAGALGIRAPKRTEEQRAYDRAMKEKEIKRRNRSDDEEAKVKEEEERAKAAVWDN
jgi:hypothetical protein